MMDLTPGLIVGACVAGAAFLTWLNAVPRCAECRRPFAPGESLDDEGRCASCHRASTLFRYERKPRSPD